MPSELLWYLGKALDLHLGKSSIPPSSFLFIMRTAVSILAAKVVCMVCTLAYPDPEEWVSPEHEWSTTVLAQGGHMRLAHYHSLDRLMTQSPSVYTFLPPSPSPFRFQSGIP